jgi:hypothetical protein
MQSQHPHPHLSDLASILNTIHHTAQTTPNHLSNTRWQKIQLFMGFESYTTGCLQFVASLWPGKHATPPLQPNAMVLALKMKIPSLASLKKSFFYSFLLLT